MLRHSILYCCEKRKNLRIIYYLIEPDAEEKLLGDDETDSQRRLSSPPLVGKGGEQNDERGREESASHSPTIDPEFEQTNEDSVPNDIEAIQGKIL